MFRGLKEEEGFFSSIVLENVNPNPNQGGNHKKNIKKKNKNQSFITEVYEL
jgi:hypothetical protein